MPSYDTNSYWQVVTRDATPAAGADAACAANVRATWPVIFQLGERILRTVTFTFRILLTT